MAWLRRGEGMVAWGVAARCRTSGPDRFADAVRLVAAGRRRSRGPRRGGAPRHRPDLLRQLRLRRRPRRQRPRGAPRRRRHRRGRSWVTVIGQDELAALPDLEPQPDTARAAQRHLRRRRDERRRLGVRGRRRGRPHRLGRAGEGRARPRPGGHRRRRHRRALAAAAAGRPLRDVLDLPRRRPLRRHPRAARPPRARPGHLPGAGRHDPSYGRRRARRSRWRGSWPGRRRTSRSTSTPSARSPTRWRRTAPRRTCPRSPSCCTCPT